MNLSLAFSIMITSSLMTRASLRLVASHLLLASGPVVVGELAQILLETMGQPVSRPLLPPLFPYALASFCPDDVLFVCPSFPPPPGLPVSVFPPLFTFSPIRLHLYTACALRRSCYNK